MDAVICLSGSLVRLVLSIAARILLDILQLVFQISIILWTFPNQYFEFHVNQISDIIFFAIQEVNATVTEPEHAKTADDIETQLTLG
jgi:hypothetical protein